MMAADPKPTEAFYNIPDELQEFHAWCCWRYQITPYGKTKVPYNPLTGRNAASNDPSTWCSFEQALAAVGFYDGIGFFFDKSFGYVGIDLDHTEDEKLIERHNQIKQFSESYAEYSPSGKGLHIICKGSIPRGVKSASKKIEMYDTGRFFTMTGNVYRNTVPTDEQQMLDFLFASISKVKDVEGLSVSPLDQAETEDDVTIYNRASTASNGDKFLKLWNGEFSGLYGSASEADLALINIIAFYSRNFAQTERIFKFSVLGKREKANRRDYIKPMIEKAFDRMAPTIEALMNMSNDFNKLLQNQKNAPETSNLSEVTDGQSGALAAPGKGDNQVPPDESDSAELVLRSTPLHLLKPPPGLLGEVATYIYESAPLPVPQIALAGAIGFLAGMCGKAFNVSGTGLNQYVLLLAETGRGKEGMRSGIRRLVASMEMTTPTIRDIIGPGKINSGQSLGPYLADHMTKCFVSIQSEFDSAYSQMIARNASSAMTSLKSAYLDLYMASGKDQTVDSSIYSDRKKTVNIVKSPSFTLLGECTITHMNKILDENQISDGLLTRFLNIVYDGDQVNFNENHSEPPNIDLVSKLCYLFNTTQTKMAQQQVIQIEMDQDSTDRFTKLREVFRRRVNDKSKPQFSALWNRAWLKAVKLAALVAAADCPHSAAVPTINIEAAEWAISIVEHDIFNIIGRFEKHEVGEQSNDLAQLRDVKKVLATFYDLNQSQKRAYRISEKMAADDVVSYFMIHSKSTGYPSLKDDKLGHAKALDKTVKVLCDLGILYDLNGDKKFMKDNYSTTQRSYRIMLKGEVLG